MSVWSEASEGFEAPFGGSAAWANNSWVVAWQALAVPAYDNSSIFVRRFASKK